MSNILHKDKHQNQLLIPMKTLKFLVVVVTFLDGDICGHFVGVQSAPCSGLSPPSCSLSVSTTSQPQCLNQFSPRSTRSPNTKGQSKCSSVTWNYLDLQQSAKNISAVLEALDLLLFYIGLKDSMKKVQDHQKKPSFCSPSCLFLSLVNTSR